MTMGLHHSHNSVGNFDYKASIYKPWSIPAHFHRNYELIYIYEGTLDIFVQGECFTLSKGDFFLIRPNSIHSFTVTEEQKAWISVFTEDNVYKFAKEYKNSQFSKFRCDPDIEAFLKKYLLINGIPQLYIIISCLNLVCDACIHNANEIKTQEINMNVFNQIYEYISENYNKAPSLKELADALGYEYHYVSLLFHKYFNMNFKAFVNLYRVQLACDFLLTTSKDILSISIECGFDNLRNFNYVFKNYTGQTPSQYRKHAKPNMQISN